MSLLDLLEQYIETGFPLADSERSIWAVREYNKQICQQP